MRNIFQKIISKIDARKAFVLIGALIIFFIALKPPIDPDLGWHIGDGIYLFAHRFQPAHQDIFSHSVPNFPLIMHEWASDILIYFIYANFGLLALTIFFALITTAAFLLVSWGLAAKREYKIIAAMLGVIASVPILGARAQMISLLGLALVIFIIFRFRRARSYKGIYWLPLIFFIWVNLHGGFAVGLFFLAVYLAVEYGKFLVSSRIRQSQKKLVGEGTIFVAVSPQKRIWGMFKKFWSWIKRRKSVVITREWFLAEALELGALWRLTAVFSLSALATLLNPYGWRIYIEVVSTIFDKYTKQIIGEWLPVTSSNPMSYQFLIYLTLLAILLLFSWRKLDVTYFLVSIPFLFLAFSSWRHMPIFLIVSNPFWVGIVEHLTGRELLRMISRRWALALLIVAAVLIARQQTKDVLARVSSPEKLAGGDYPYGAVQYLKTHPIPGPMLNEYNWGGYLIWQYPERKVFIDGRMPSWKMGDFRIFKEFSDLMGTDPGWEDKFKQYNFGFALVYNNSYNDGKFNYLKWKKAYGDDLAAIYQRTNNSKD